MLRLLLLGGLLALAIAQETGGPTPTLVTDPAPADPSTSAITILYTKRFRLPNQRNSTLKEDVCAKKVNGDVRLNIQGISGREIQAVCWSASYYTSNTLDVNACGKILTDTCIPRSTYGENNHLCAKYSPADLLSGAVPDNFKYTECVNIAFAGVGQDVAFEIEGLDINKLEKIGVFSIASGDTVTEQSVFGPDSACNNYGIGAHTCDPCNGGDCPYHPPDPEKIACCLKDSKIPVCDKGKECVEISFPGCLHIKGDPVGKECPPEDNPFAKFACERRACCKKYGGCEVVSVAECLKNEGTPLKDLQCPADSTYPCKTSGCCLSKRQANYDTLARCTNGYPPGACRLLGGFPLERNCSEGDWGDAQCNCCLDVKKKCLQRKDDNKNPARGSGFWADMFADSQSNSVANVGSTSSSTSTNQFDWISIESMSSVASLTIDGAKFDEWDESKHTGVMSMNGWKWELKEECEVKCDECRNGTFVVILINHCPKELEYVKVVDQPDDQYPVVKYVDVPKAKDGHKGIKVVHIERCVACGLKNKVEVRSPLESAAGLSITEVGDAFCLLHASAEFEVNNARNDPKPFEPFNTAPSSGSTYPSQGHGQGQGQGQGSLLGPSPPWAHRPGTLFGRVP